LGVSENNRINLHNVLKQKNEKIEEMKNEIIKLLKLFKELGEEVNWSKDKVQQKESENKTLKDKIKRMQIEYDKLLKFKPEYPKPEKVELPIEDETLTPVTANKQLLFGDEFTW